MRERRIRVDGDEWFVSAVRVGAAYGEHAPVTGPALTFRRDQPEERFSASSAAELDALTDDELVARVRKWKRTGR